MSSIHIRKMFVLFITVFVIGAIAQDYSVHPAVLRIKMLDGLLMEQHHMDNAKRIAVAIRSEISLNTPSHNAHHKHELNYAESMVTLLKLLAIVRDRFQLDYSNETQPFFAEEDFWHYYSNAMKELIIKSPEEPAIEFQTIRNFTEYVFDWYSCYELMEILSSYQQRYPEIEWIHYVFMLAIENSSHLKNSFSKGMLLKLNNIRNKANAIHSIQLIRRYNVSEHFLRFSFQKIIIDLELSTRDRSNVQAMETQMKRVLIEDTLRYSLFIRTPLIVGSVQERSEAIVHSAFLELTVNEMEEFIDELIYVVNLYEIALDSNIISAFNSMLKRKLAMLHILNNGFTEKLHEFTEAMSHNDWIFESTMNLTPKRLNLWIIIAKKLNKLRPTELVNKMLYIFYATIGEIYEAIVKDDNELLTQLDQNHIALYEANEELFHIKPQWLNVFTAQNLEKFVNRTEILFNSIALESPGKTFDVRNQIRILLRLGLQICNQHNDDHSQIVNGIVERLTRLYCSLMKLGIDVFMNDMPLIKEWYLFTLNFPQQISIALDELTITQLTHFAQTTHHYNDSSAVLYVFFARIVNFLAEQNVQIDTNQLIWQVMVLEDIVDYADTTTPFVLDQILREKQLFYIHYSFEALEYWTDLTDLLEHHVEFITSLPNWNDNGLVIEQQYNLKDFTKLKLLDAIYTAVHYDPQAEFNIEDPFGRLRYKVNQLMGGFIRKHKISNDFADKIANSTQFFGIIV